MDNSWSVRPAGPAAAGLGAAGALVWCMLTPDPAGRLLIGLTALALGFAALYGARARPRLAADPDGITVGGLRGPRRFPWSAVRRLEVVRTRRFGRDVPTLEIETARIDPATGQGPSGGAEDRLHVFSGLELGADPRDVADALAALRPDG